LRGEESIAALILPGNQFRVDGSADDKVAFEGLLQRRRGMGSGRAACNNEKRHCDRTHTNP
jgi:hypothetical protein